MIVYLFCAFSVLCALVLSFIYNNAGYILICVGFIIIYVCTDKVTRTEQCESDKFSRRHLNRNILKHKNNAKASSEESLRKSDQRKSQKSYERYLDFKAGLLSFSEKMWSSPNSKPRPKPRFSGNNPLNSSMPMHLSSPLTTRQRILENGSLDRSVLNSSVVNGLGTQNGHSGASSPLFSSPFMPQIKRALGLEPTGQNKYREPRRHSYGISAGGTTLDSSKVTGILPHVKLTPTRRLSLTERNSTMLNRGSTVKIAPPVAGKPLNSSLCQLRTEPFAADERPTPDTHAVVTALKERRKRSMNVHEENSDIPAQQAKRRRQESQHSNASTSSMPAMPDNLPDLSGTEFNMRLETPSIKRPSRPSQGEMDDLLSSPSVKRVCGEGRNNSILSSLSSSQRFLAAQSSKRKAETSFTEAQDGTSIKQQRNESSSQRGEPPKLTHIDYTPQKLEKVKKMLIEDNSEDVTFKQEDHANNSKENKELEEITTKPTLRNVPSMKKTASVYAGLSSRGSFRKAQYANVVATLDDYDTDREAEHERVQQMLKHVDESFTKKLEEKTTPVTTTVSVVVSTSLVPAVTTTVTIATAGVATTTSSTASILSHLEKLSKSPIQETGYLKAVFTSDGEPTKASLPPVSFKSLFPATTTSTGTLGTSLTTISGTQSTFTGFSGIQTTNMSAVTTASVPLSLGQATTSVASPGFKALFPTGSVQPIPLATSSTPASGFMFGASASSALSFGTSASVAPSSVTTGLPFGMPLVSSSGSATGLGSSQSIANTTGGLSAGLSFGSTSKTSSTAAPSLFQFGATSTAASSSTSTPAAGFTFGAPSGISAGSSAPFGASTTSSAAQSPFGAPVASSNTVASIFGTSSNSQMPFGTQTSNAATVFSFGANQKTTTAASIFTLSAGPTSSTAGASLFGSQPSSSSTAGFSFGVGGNQTATGFQFGNKPQTSSVFGAINAASPFGTTSSAAPAFGSTNQTQAFGLSNQTPAFGSTNQTPAFGSTNQTSAFGLTNQTLSFGSSNQTPAFGSSNQTAAFGSTNQTPAFGSTNQTPAFGSTSQAPAFGQSNSISGFGASSNPASVFGSGFAASTQKSNTPVFGASTNTASNSVFGNTGTPGFGKSQSMPAFGTSDSTLSGFNFGGPAPNVNPFGQGQTTPLKQTGSAFGMPSVDTTPKNQTGAMFQFGQSQNNNSSASKGFDFGAGASGSNTGGFNFTFSSSSMPGFNFMGTGATATPGLGTPGSFAVGTGDSAPRPPRAAASRANRRRPAVRK
ncbi:nuclear pore complex protein DDB_G0274915-like isoform X4 [Dreissena polymorpha]|uniref:nuclear pore complex protein DDB_G0274915-like isoform X4 n=1 Tax=Dreissena polymorpha TaxID=45954 RepID=UPI0022643A58|nr:nuclear pore complex protein DDB_G0274915-like isoform X4 [Dreissena polymorpha]